MIPITDLMSRDHRTCDEAFARAETHAARGDWSEATAALASFAELLESHFCAEEQLLFPRFEAVTGMTGGPTRMMRSEHIDMREALARMREALERHDRDDYAGEAETLLILMQQHNMKEENILYPMCDNHLAAERAELSPQLAGRLGAGRPA